MAPGGRSHKHILSMSEENPIGSYGYRQAAFDPSMAGNGMRRR
jgi:hypothetical protein